MLGSSPLGSKTLGDNADSANNIVSVRINNLIAATDSVEQLFVFNDSVALKIAAASTEVIGEVSTAEILINATDNIQQRFVFDDTAQFVKITADSIATVADYDTIIFNTVTATDNIQQRFVFDDTAQFVQFSASEDSYIAIFDTVTMNTIAVEDSTTQSFNFVPQLFIEVSAESIQSSTHAFNDIGSFVKLGVASNEISVSIEDEGILELGISDEIAVVFNIVSDVPVEIESTADVSSSLSDISSGLIEWDARTFAKGYTRWQQIYVDDTVELTLKGNGDGIKILSPQQISKQLWIG